MLFSHQDEDEDFVEEDDDEEDDEDEYDDESEDEVRSNQMQDDFKGFATTPTKTYQFLRYRSFCDACMIQPLANNVKKSGLQT